MPRGEPELGLKMTKQRAARGWNRELIIRFCRKFPGNPKRAEIELETFLEKKRAERTDELVTTGVGQSRTSEPSLPTVAIESAGKNGPWRITIVVRDFSDAVKLKEFVDRVAANPEDVKVTR